jgi:hypothetical protein
MTFKNGRIIAAAMLALGVSVPVIAGPSVAAAESTGLRADSTHAFASYSRAAPGWHHRTLTRPRSTWTGRAR